MVERVLRLQLVVPFELVIVRSKPPSKKPQETPLSFSRSPMFLPAKFPRLVELEQTSPVGSASLTNVMPPFPSLITEDSAPLIVCTPLVCPEIRLMAPSVEGPKLVPYELSLIA